MISKTDFSGAVTTTTVTAEPGSLLDGYGIVGEGVARCRSNDVYSRSIGEDLAIARAIQDFGRQIEEKALDRTVSLDDADRVLAIVLEDMLEGLFA
jgi:hypothetical protein